MQAGQLPADWKLCPLVQVATLQRGYDLPIQNRAGGRVPVIAASSIVGSHNEAKVKGPGVVTGRSGSIGNVLFVPGDYWPLNTTLYVKDFHGNDRRYVFYLLQQMGLERFHEGTGVPTLNRNNVHTVRVPVPPLPEQRRIAAILDKADALRAKRREALAQLDRLTQSIFIEMFGDPVTNPMGWSENQTLGEVADIVSGVTKGRKLSGKATREVPYLAVANVQDMRLNLDIVKTIEATEDEISRYTLVEGDLLLTEGGDPDKLGRGTLWREELPECIHQNHIFRVRLLSKQVTPCYLNWLIGSQRGKRYFLKSAKQTTGIASVNMTQLRGFPLLMPPMRLQRHFEEALGDLARHMERLARSANEFDALFSSLQHCAFRGEL